MLRITACFLLLPAAALGAGAGAAGGQVLLWDTYSARSVALGDPGAAICDDVNVIHSNPAGIALLPSNAISASDILWAGGTFNIPSFCGAYRIGKAGTIGLTGIFFSMDPIQTYDTGGSAEEEAVVSDALVGFAYAINAADHVESLRAKGVEIGVGAQVKYIREKLAGWADGTVAADVGVLLRSKAISGGISYGNLGGGLTFITTNTPLQSKLRIGGAFAPALKGGHRALLAAEAIVPAAGDFVFAIGGEFSFLGVVALRAGYRPTGFEIGTFSAGLGFSYPLRGAVRRVALDYAFLPTTELGLSHVISFGAQFGEERPGWKSGGTSSAEKKSVRKSARKPAKKKSAKKSKSTKKKSSKKKSKPKPVEDEFLDEDDGYDEYPDDDSGYEDVEDF